MTDIGAFNTKKPPSKHAMQKLADIAFFRVDGLPAQELNFTVRDKLLAFEYVTMRPASSKGWYKHGRDVDFLYVTTKGVEALAAWRKGT